MRHRHIRTTSTGLVLTAGGLALTAILAACGGASSGSSTDGAGGHSGMTGSSAASAAPTGSRAGDVAFAQQMIPHHQQAVEMADLALTCAQSPQIKTLATAIKKAQDPEIATMTDWLTRWKAPLAMSGDMGGMDMGGSGTGMMSDTDMASLGAARGAAFDKMWLAMMVAHHTGAVAMAQQVLAATKDAQVKALADAIVKGQTAEIATMQQILAG